MQVRLRTLAVWAACMGLTAGESPVMAQGLMYKYKEKDGTVWFTDHPAPTQHQEEMEFVGFHGREPATASCVGVNRNVLDARARKYEFEIETFAGHYGVPVPLVLAIISVESCFDELAVSRAGAQGLMQLMPATATEVEVENPFDPRQNIRGGVRYFSKMRTRFDGDIRLALAAYNAGPSAVDRYKGIPPYRETRHYVKKVLERYRMYFSRTQGTARR